MNPISLHPVILYVLLSFILILKGFIVYFIFLYYRHLRKDVLIFIDKSDRFKIIYDKLMGMKDYIYKGKKYFLIEKRSILNFRGKALYVFSENKPQPLLLKYDTAKWLSGESMMAIINNKLIQQLVKTTSDLEDKLILFGAIGGMIAGMASVIIMLKQFGVI